MAPEKTEPYVVQRGLEDPDFPNSYERSYPTLAEAEAAFKEAVKEVPQAEWRVAKWDPIKREFQVYHEYRRGVGRPRQERN